MATGPLFWRACVISAIMGAAMAWPARDMDIAHGRPEDDGKGADKIVHLGFAGMGYCPYAFFAAENRNQGTLASYILDAPSHKEAVERLSHTLHDYLREGSQFLDGTPAPHTVAYSLSGRAHAALVEQFGSVKNSREKIGFCLTAMAAIVTGRPVVAGRLITCSHENGCTVRVGNTKSSLLKTRADAFTAESVEVVGMSRPQQWPHGHSAIDASSARVVFARFWGLQAIVTKARIPVVHKPTQPGARRVLHMDHGILVSFRGTTSFSALNAVQIKSTTPGKRLLAKPTASDKDIASKAGNHQWAMNMRTDLTSYLVDSPGGEDEPEPDAKTIDGISHEAMLLVNGELHGSPTRPYNTPEIHQVGRERDFVPSVCQVVKEMVADQDDIPVMTTGHSKGGALSILGAFLLRRCLKDTRAKVTTVVSVEGPRVGNGAFVQRFVESLKAATEATQSETGWEFNVFRVVKKNDPVTEQPFPSKGDHRHVPGLLSVPVVTMLDEDVLANPPRVKLPPVFVCDSSNSVSTIVGWDAVRRQRGYLTLPKTNNLGRAQDVCIRTSDGTTIATDLLQGGRLAGVTCNLCTAQQKPRDSCEEKDYRENGKDNQLPLKPFGQSLADRALITHPFFGPTFALCPAHQSVSTFTNSMVPTYKGGSHHHDASSIEQEALSFAPKDPPEAEQAHVNDFNSFRSLRRDSLATGNSQRHLRARG
ncbi:hypothetical protein FNF29_07189 [Cafeteria roenbergensis]|uniref:Fungal lipase-type domain-containing protein n=1 Tax=Cafeteria roenbergensis TaxID=33653 RepID=A0A5A8CFK2_CAFRO|nr:hypothetical protein FNF29_07189 [Cafeteria roenbergensis]KAA0151785.1 hypothetical protein FNF31_06736 [Cafeteria roenbergensis]KAA0153242.1 hypothetical protein FNF28_06976 [Cafeteria roenbergensis]|eukprot:KAA0147634.1 hypothetical protein FNF29_07189 [Cafeteria roenbergensis]